MNDIREFVIHPAALVAELERKYAWATREKMRDHHSAERKRGDRPTVKNSEKEFIFLGW